MDVECCHCWEDLKKHYVHNNKLNCNKIDSDGEISQYRAMQDLLDDDDVYLDVVHGEGKDAKNWALLPMGESMTVEYNGATHTLTKTDSRSTGHQTKNTLTEKITKSKIKQFLLRCEGKETHGQMAKTTTKEKKAC